MVNQLDPVPLGRTVDLADLDSDLGMRQRRDSQSVDLGRGKYYFPEFRDFPGYSCLRGRGEA